MGEVMNSMKESNVGQMIKSLRDKQKLSLRALAELSKISTNAISKIERGETSPTVASLHQLAAALGVHITDLFAQDIHKVAVFVKKDDATIIKSNGITIEGLGSGLPHQQLEPFIMEISPASGNIADPVSHSGEEFIHCLEGKVECFVGNESFILKPGDRLLFKAAQPHCWRNLGTSSAKVILVLQTDRQKPFPHRLH
ncbi:MAG: hypothetical protein B6I38_11125 [Anaerolineaceae bacterium 4572_5.1]|nr:MAG: hypothetical protein B6I38_11125 [Anaerolineaceae bacterium 4572_5.1]